jgi:acetoacetyl-CoA synthetase
MTDKRLPEKSWPVARGAQRPENVARTLNEAALRNPDSAGAIRDAMSVHARQRQDLQAGSSDSTLESFLTGVWEDSFGFPPIGPQDDFFELGGNSLHAASLISKIRTLTGCALPIATFLHAPTIERLAQMMRAGEAVSSNGLVLLRDGNRERPLFVAHSISGTVLELWHWHAKWIAIAPSMEFRAAGSVKAKCLILV